MSLDRLINQLIRMVTRRAVNFGINKGVELAAGKGKPASQMTAAERKAAQDSRAAIKRARQAARITRRLGR